MRKNKEPLNLVCFTFKSEKERYCNFLIDFVFKYCNFNNDRINKILKFKRTANKIKFLEDYIYDYCPRFIVVNSVSNGLFTFEDTFAILYEKWKEGGDSFEE